jgi:hypothetical protein
MSAAEGDAALARLRRHLTALWPRWTLLPAAPYAAFLLFVLLMGDLRWDHVALMIAILALLYGNAATKKLAVGLYPMGLVALLYNAMGYVKNLGVSPDRVHDCDLYALELKLFGFTSGGRRITPGDWFTTHHTTALDVYFAFPYGTFIFACLAAGVVLYFRDYPALLRFSWSFFVMNVAAFVTYHVYPAAPPWYFHEHGCEISMTALPSAGARLTHVDEVLGIGFFHSMYSRSSDLYGAVPSLHVAYPLLIVVEGWKSFGWPGRVLSVVFALTMSVAAVYLDHHWVVDVMLGYVYFLASTVLVRWALGRRAAPGAPPSPAHSNSFSM